MSIGGIEALGGAGFTPYVAPQVGATGAPAQVNGSTSVGGSFSDMVLDGIDRLEGVQDKADGPAVRAAHGDLANIQDFPNACSATQVATRKSRGGGRRVSVN